MNTIGVFVMGGLGCVARYWLGLWLHPRFSSIGAATWTVNLIGSFVIGLIATALAAAGSNDGRLRLLLVVGLLGGFTTYSSFAYETWLWSQARSMWAALGYVLVTVLGCWLICGLGIVLGRLLIRE